jgi:uncharacterized protein YndB with AHSA1/START domain
MSLMDPKYQVQLKVRKPATEVFDAVVAPEKLSSYFVQAASAPLVEGTTVNWRFAEIPGEHDVRVIRVVKDQTVGLEFDRPDGGKLQVEMVFLPIDASATTLKISETGWRTTPEDIAESYGNAGGWMHMMCCLKAWLEYGINLRAGGAR